jgi:hypothetical protein
MVSAVSSPSLPSARAEEGRTQTQVAEQITVQISESSQPHQN